MFGTTLKGIRWFDAEYCNMLSLYTVLEIRHEGFTVRGQTVTGRI
jgi:hypothetical protein